MKRIFDLTICLILITLLLIPIVIICCFLKIDTKGPILNISNRVGKNKKKFKMLKFRTMKVDTPVLHSNDLKNPDKYITDFGRILRKYSLDEIPQIFNILKGEMSIVGPRPPLDNQIELINKRDRLGINEMIPGLTGYAQVNGRDEISIDKKVKYDLIYKNNQSFLLDFKILLKTIVVVLKSKNIKH